MGWLVKHMMKSNPKAAAFACLKIISKAAETGRLWLTLGFAEKQGRTPTRKLRHGPWGGKGRTGKRGEGGWASAASGLVKGTMGGRQSLQPSQSELSFQAWFALEYELSLAVAGCFGSCLDYVSGLS